jgi:hypothetical protein
MISMGRMIRVIRFKDIGLLVAGSYQECGGPIGGKGGWGGGHDEVAWLPQRRGSPQI